MEPTWLEFAAVYAAIPVVFAIAVDRYGYRGAMAPILWVVSLALGVALGRSPSFDSSVLWALPLDHAYVRVMLLRFAVLGPGLLLLGRWLVPDAFLWFPRRRPVFWAAFLLLYPLFSALPQGLIWRVFLVHRYAALSGGHELLLICIGAAAFALAHLAFWNLTAILVTAVGGAMFMSTYLATHSMLLAALEHGAYGCVAFTAGFGAFLYRGARTRVASTQETRSA